MNDIVIIGLGSPLMSDEGIGVHLLRKLEARGEEFPGVDFVDLGTAGARVLHAIAGRRKAIFVDCAFMDEKPGTLRRFSPDDVRSQKNLPRMSLHEGDLIKFLKISRTLGEAPDEIVIFGIQPESLEQGEALSLTLASNMDRYIAAIAEEIRGENA